MKPLRKTKRKLYHFKDGKKVVGVHSGLKGRMGSWLIDHNYLWGDCTGLYGECSGLWGDCTGLYGDCTEIVGNCTGLKGDCSELEGTITYLTGDCTGLRGELRHQYWKLYGDCTGLTGDITYFQGDCTDIHGDLDQIREEIDQIERTGDYPSYDVGHYIEDD